MPPGVLSGGLLSVCRYRADYGRSFLAIIVALGSRAAEKQARAPTKPILRTKVQRGRKGNPLERILSCAELLRRLAMSEPCIELVDQLFRGIGNYGARREDRLGTGLVQRVVVLRRHHA